MPDTRQFVRDNLFLVAAVLLPVIVVGLFLAASAVPRWLVAPPAYDLLLRAVGPYDRTRSMSVDFTVRDGRLEATVRALPANSYSESPRLFLFDHRTLNVREIPLNLPTTLTEKEPAVTVPVGAIADRRVVADVKAPDGYEFQSRRNESPGLIGDLFGMRRYGENPSVVNRGRVVPISLPLEQHSYGGVSFVGWIVNEGAR